MKKRICLLLISFLILFSWVQVHAESIFEYHVLAGIGSDICEQAGILKSFKLVGNILFVVKILVPIILIVLGSVDFGKAVINSNQDAIKQSAKSFIRRIALGVFIFLIPTIVSFVFTLMPTNNGNFQKCSNCLFHPNECQTN